MSSRVRGGGRGGGACDVACGEDCGRSASARTASASRARAPLQANCKDDQRREQVRRRAVGRRWRRRPASHHPDSRALCGEHSKRLQARLVQKVIGCRWHVLLGWEQQRRMEQAADLRPAALAAALGSALAAALVAAALIIRCRRKGIAKAHEDGAAAGPRNGASPAARALGADVILDAEAPEHLAFERDPTTAHRRIIARPPVSDLVIGATAAAGGTQSGCLPAGHCWLAAERRRRCRGTTCLRGLLEHCLSERTQRIATWSPASVRQRTRTVEKGKAGHLVAGHEPRVPIGAAAACEVDRAAWRCGGKHLHQLAHSRAVCLVVDRHDTCASRFTVDEALCQQPHCITRGLF
eukprot:3070624-Prymnesium_polylepis.2